MALVANFTSNVRVGDGVLNVTFTDTSSGGTVTSRKWVFGDGVISDTGSSVQHTYMLPGKYSVTLIINTSSNQVSVTKTDFIIVNQVYSVPQFIIMQSFDALTSKYWKFYLDQDFHLMYEDELNLYRSIQPVATMKKWVLVEFHVLTKKVFYGNIDQYRKEVGVYIIPNSSPIPITVSKAEIVPYSTIKIDELKIWSKEVDLSKYFSSTRGRAGRLDSL